MQPNYAKQQPQQKMGPIDRWLVNYLMLAAILFAGCYAWVYVQGSDYSTRGAAVLLAGIIALKALTVPSSPSSYRGRSTVLLFMFLVLAIFNMCISWDKVETSLRWLLWLTQVISLARVMLASEGAWLPVVIRRLPFLFTLVYVVVIITASYQKGNATSSASAYHLSGLYGNLILATGLFAAKAWQRGVWTAFGFVAIFLSGAGGALFTVPIMFVPYILYSTSSMPVKGIAVAGLLLVGGAFFVKSQMFSKFLDIKLGTESTAGFAYNGMERLERSKEMRIQLVQYGVDLAMHNPLGTGMGHTYAEDVGRTMGVGHVHNGTISMLIELGLPGFTVVASLLLWIFWSILRSKVIANQTKAFYFTYFFTIFGRSLSENYTPFDLGNFFNIVFLLFTSFLFLHQQLRLAPPPWRPMPFRPPGLANRPPQWAHPVGMR